MRNENLISCTLVIGLLAGSSPGAASEKTTAKSRKSWAPSLLPQDETMSSTGRNRFFILETGHQRVYRGKEGHKTVDLVITVLDQTKRVAGVETRVVEERESANGQLVEVSRNYFAIGATTKNVYYFGEEVDIYNKGRITSHEGAWLAGVNGANHGIAMPAENKVGDKYYQEQSPKVALDRAETISLTETVHTPAGTFEHCLKVRETTPLEPGVGHKLYAPGIGLVSDGALKLVGHGFVSR